MLPDLLIHAVVVLTYPINFSLCVLACAVLARALGRRRSAVALGAFAVLWSLTLSIPRVSDALRSPLERANPRVALATAIPEADAIVVLGGGSISPTVLQQSRLATAAKAWRAGRAPVVILSGGGGRMGSGRGRTEAERMAEAIAKLGVPASALLLETRSRSTEDNAIETAAVARPRGIRQILLVTSALHMPRASMEFRNVGFEVLPVTSARWARDRSWSAGWAPSAAALHRSGRALKEYAGLVAAHAGISTQAVSADPSAPGPKDASTFRTGFTAQSQHG